MKLKNSDVKLIFGIDCGEDSITTKSYARPKDFELPFYKRRCKSVKRLDGHALSWSFLNYVDNLNNIKKYNWVESDEEKKQVTDEEEAEEEETEEEEPDEQQDNDEAEERQEAKCDQPKDTDEEEQQQQTNQQQEVNEQELTNQQEELQEKSDIFHAQGKLLSNTKANCKI
ncbi:glutamic acid-rich protein-like [Camellia sinensis]|uniref:glutamic acid-rich protein-like n=1 Tax=Camellia sinensis TaxID=4442 RepID=UPI0010362315|nr:glutamic acid-rich protein-like [Camellia sinensis]